MDIKELSIGNWVRYDFPEIGKRNIQVNSIDEEDNHIGAGGVGASAWSDVSEFEPIPLTPEILEKNGFEENCGRWYNSEALMEFEPYKDGWCRTINCGEYSVYFIKYVHQLQNALRLAGVEKEIVL